jgi:protein SCO1/2
MKVILYTFFVLILFSCQKQETLPYYHLADFTPLWADEKEFAIDTLHRIAPFRFTDQQSRAVTSETVKGKIYVANFFFTACPSICPRMTNHLTKVQRAFASDNRVMILSHSVMPWADSVSRLKEYANVHHINNDQWRLLTGRQSEIYELARKSYFAEEVAGFKRDSTDFVHTEHCLLVDQEGHLRGIYKGTVELDIDRMIGDIRLLLK